MAELRSYARPRSGGARARADPLRARTANRATIAFNRPEVLNAFDFQTLRELSRAVEDASWDDASA